MANMNRREYSALMSAVDEIMGEERAFVSENSKWYEEVKTFGMNWSACVTNNIEEAKKFAEKIKKACKLIEKLNDMQIIVSYEDSEKTDRESYKALVTKCMEELKVIC